jgi:hypothetical protein
MRKELSTTILVLIVFMWCAQQASANIHMNASVKNEQPLLNNVSTFSMYVSHDDKKQSDNFVICQNQPYKKIYVEADALDPNGFQDISSAQSKLLIFAENESEYSRLGSYAPMTFIQGIGSYAIFESTLLMLPQDTAAVAPSHFTIRVRIGDLNTSVIGSSDFTYSHGNCTAYFNDSVSVRGGESQMLDFADVMLWISANQDANGTISIVESEYNLDLALSEIENPGFRKYFYVEFTDRLTDAILGSEIRFYYPEALDIDESSFRLYSWQNSSWIAENSQLNTIENYISAIMDTDKTYTVLGSSLSSAGCKPKWRCSDWSVCIAGNQKRTCRDANSCYKPKSVPVTLKDCHINNNNPKNDKDPLLPSATSPVEKASEEEIPVELPALFDIVVDLPKDTATGQLLAKISLTNFGRPGWIIVNVTYSILDAKRNIVFRKSEERSVETQLEYLTTFDISMLTPGNYILAADMTYPGQKTPARSEKIFKVVKKGSIEIFVVIGALMIIFSAGAFYYRKSFSAKPIQMIPGPKNPKKSKNPLDLS